MARQYATVLAAGNFDLVADPTVAANHLGYITAYPEIVVGTVEVTADDVCVFTAHTPGVAQLAARPCHLVAYVTPDVVRDAGASNPVFTIAGFDNAGTPIAQNGTATFAVPTYAPSSVRKFKAGFGVSVDAALPFSSVTGVTMAGAAEAVGMKIKILALPLVSDFEVIKGFSDHTLPTLSRDDIAVREGADPKAYNVLGDISDRSLKLKAAIFNGISGLDAYEGVPCTVMIVDRRAGKVVSRSFYTRFIVSGTRDFAYGNQAGMREVSSGVVDCAIVLAPTT